MECGFVGGAEGVYSLGYRSLTVAAPNDAFTTREVHEFVDELLGAAHRHDLPVNTQELTSIIAGSTVGERAIDGVLTIEDARSVEIHIDLRPSTVHNVQRLSCIITGDREYELRRSNRVRKN